MITDQIVLRHVSKWRRLLYTNCFQFSMNAPWMVKLLMKWSNKKFVLFSKFFISNKHSIFYQHCNHSTSLSIDFAYNLKFPCKCLTCNRQQALHSLWSSSNLLLLLSFQVFAMQDDTSKEILFTVVVGIDHRTVHSQVNSKSSSISQLTKKEKEVRNLKLVGTYLHVQITKQNISLKTESLINSKSAL